MKKYNLKKTEEKREINVRKNRIDKRKVAPADEREYIPDLRALFPIGRSRITVSDFVGQVDRVYRGLGIPTLYETLSILANKSVFFIGLSGMGKTRLMRLIPTIHGTNVSNWDTFTYRELSDYCQTIMDVNTGSVTNKHLVFKIEDFATFRRNHKEHFLTIGSRIASDNTFVHITRHSPYLNIQNCKLTMLVAIQPSLYNDLCANYTEWQALSSRRFTKFIMLNPLRSETLDVDLIPTLPRKIDQQVIFDQKKVDFDRLLSMYKEHVGEGRSMLFARDYAIAMAKFMGATTVEQEHVDLVHRLFHPYLNSFAALQRAKDLDSPVMVKTSNMRLLGEIGKYSDYASKHKLAKDLHVSERSIERPAKELLEAGLIEKPSAHAAQYRLSETLRRYFQWYSEISC